MGNLQSDIIISAKRRLVGGCAQAPADFKSLVPVDGKYAAVVLRKKNGVYIIGPDRTLFGGRKFLDGITQAIEDAWEACGDGKLAIRKQTEIVSGSTFLKLRGQPFAPTDTGIYANQNLVIALLMAIEEAGYELILGWNAHRHGLSSILLFRKCDNAFSALEFEKCPLDVTVPAGWRVATSLDAKQDLNGVLAKLDRLDIYKLFDGKVEVESTKGWIHKLICTNRRIEHGFLLSPIGNDYLRMQGLGATKELAAAMRQVCVNAWTPGCGPVDACGKHAFQIRMLPSGKSTVWNPDGSNHVNSAHLVLGAIMEMELHGFRISSTLVSRCSPNSQTDIVFRHGPRVDAGSQYFAFVLHGNHTLRMIWPRWSIVEGTLDGAGDLLVECMTVDQAKQKCNELSGCLGFCHPGQPTSEKVEIHFASANSVTRSHAWTSFLKVDHGTPRAAENAVKEVARKIAREYTKSEMTVEVQRDQETDNFIVWDIELLQSGRRTACWNTETLEESVGSRRMVCNLLAEIEQAGFTMIGAVDKNEGFGDASTLVYRGSYDKEAIRGTPHVLCLSPHGKNQLTLMASGDFRDAASMEAAEVVDRIVVDLHKDAAKDRSRGLIYQSWRIHCDPWNSSYRGDALIPANLLLNLTYALDAIGWQPYEVVGLNKHCSPAMQPDCKSDAPCIFFIKWPSETGVSIEGVSLRFASFVTEYEDSYFADEIGSNDSKSVADEHCRFFDL